ncbi:hypothetical protein C8F01DRAFT_1339237 [Mycena amicta]|nr:hypothetical protein C8F01DRAFT_1339237 [Mycena amicta]
MSSGRSADGGCRGRTHRHYYSACLYTRSTEYKAMSQKKGSGGWVRKSMAREEARELSNERQLIVAACEKKRTPPRITHHKITHCSHPFKQKNPNDGCPAEATTEASPQNGRRLISSFPKFENNCMRQYNPKNDALGIEVESRTERWRQIWLNAVIELADLKSWHGSMADTGDSSSTVVKEAKRHLILRSSRVETQFVS